MPTRVQSPLLPHPSLSSNRGDDVSCKTVITGRPENDQRHKEAENVDDEEDAFGDGQCSSAEDDECRADYHEGHDEGCRLP